MNSDVQKDEYDVIPENNKHALEYPSGEEIIYEEYIDADRVIESYNEDGEVVYYTEDGAFEEVILGDDDSDIIYEEVMYEDVTGDKELEDVVCIQQEKDNEEVILGDNPGDNDKENKELPVEEKNEVAHKKTKEKKKVNKNSDTTDKSKEDTTKKDSIENKDNKEVNVQSNVNSNNAQSNNNLPVGKVNNALSNDLQNNNSNVQSNNNLPVGKVNNASSNDLQNNNNGNVQNSNNLPVGKVNNASSNDLQNNNNGNVQNSNNLPVGNVNNTSSNDLQNNNNGNVQNSNNLPVDNSTNNNQNSLVGKSVFTQEEKDSLVSDENALVMSNTNSQQSFVGTGGVSKGVPVVEINLENSKSSLNRANNLSNVQGMTPYQGNAAMMTDQQIQSGIPGVQSMNAYPMQGQVPVQANFAQPGGQVAYQMQGQTQSTNVNRPMVAQPMSPYQSQLQANAVSQPGVPVAQPMGPYPTQNQVGVQAGMVAQPQIISSVAVPYQNPVMNQPYQSAIPVATSGAVPPSNLNYQANAQQMMGQVNAPIMYQAAAYPAQSVQQMGQGVYQNGGVQGVRMNPYQAMKPATTTTTTKSANSSSDKSIYKKNHGFLKFLLLLIFLAIVGLGVYIVFFRESNYTGKANLNALYDPFKLIPVHKENLVGYVNWKGETVIEPTYQDGSDFYGDFAFVLSDEVYKMINKDGDIVLTAKTEEKPVYNKDYDVWLIDNNLYDNQMTLLASNVEDNNYGFYSYVDSGKGEVGLIDYTGKKFYSSSGSVISVETSETFTNDSYALVKIDGSEDVIISNVTRDVVYKAAANSIKAEGGSVFLVNINGVNKYLYFYEGKLVKEFDNVASVIMYNYKKRILQVTNVDGGEYYYDTINNTELTDAVFNVLLYDEEYYGYEITTLESDDDSVKFGLAKDGETIFDCIYDYIWFFEPELHEFVKIRTLREYVCLVRDKTVQLYDLTLKKMIVEFDNVEISEEGTFVIFSASSDSSNKEDVVYNLLTNKMLSFSAGENYFISGSNYIIAVDKNNKAIYYNIKLENIYETSNFEQ